MANKVTTLIDVSTQDELYPRTKTSAVSDSDGNTLGDVAVWNALDVASGVNTVKVGLDMDLLWTNSAPTSSFSAQTVSVDLTDYKIAIIVSKVTKTGAFYTTNYIVVGSTNTIVFPMDYIYFRDATVSTTGVTFGGGKRSNTYGASTPTSDDNDIIPYQIYGVR